MRNGNEGGSALQLTKSWFPAAPAFSMIFTALKMNLKSRLAPQNPSTARVNHRSGEIVDMLVFMLVAILLPAWILGTLYLSFFPASANASGSADSQLVANADSPKDPSSLGDSSEIKTDPQDATDQNSEAIGSVSNSETDGDFNPSQANLATALTADQTAAYNERIKLLQDQLDAKSQEVEQLRRDSMPASSDDSDGTADTSLFKNQIADLTKERDQLKTKLLSADQSSEKITQLEQQLRTLETRTTSQKTEIQTLQDRLTESEEAKRNAEIQLAKTRSELASQLADSSPPLAGSIDSNRNFDFREWVSSRGSKARLAFVRWENDSVIVVNEAGKEFRLALNRLSSADQTYVNDKR